MNTISIYFDGGCSPNPGNKYGSYQVEFDGQTVLGAHQIQLGYGTNNEAEFESLQLALSDVGEWLELNGFKHCTFSVRIETDSVIVRNRLIRKNRIHSKPAWKSASERMFNLAESCLVHLRKFASFAVEWKGRENNVARFGH